MSSIKTLIDAYIKRNANQEITGPVLNGVLTAIADALGTPFIGEDGYWYTYDPEAGQFVQTDTPAQGESGVVAAYAAVGIGPDPSALPSVDVIYDATLRQLDFTFYDIQGPKGDQGTPGITGASVSVDANVGTPSVDASIVNSILTLAFHNLRGAAAGFGTPTISVGANQGTPSASVTASGPDTAKVFAFAFDGLKGETGPQGPQGPQGNPGSSQDYPFTLANNLTTDDSTVALTAAMGVQLEGEVSQLSQEMDKNYKAGAYLDKYDAEISDSLWGYSEYIPYTSGEVIWRWNNDFSSATGPCIVMYNSNKEKVDYWAASSASASVGGRRLTSIPAGTAFIRCSFKLGEEAYLYIGGVRVWSPIDSVKGRISKNEADIASITQKTVGLAEETLTPTWVNGEFPVYSNGVISTTSNNVQSASIPLTGIVSLSAFICGDGATAAAFAFYSSETPSSSSYIQSGSVFAKDTRYLPGPGSWVSVPVPAGAVLCVVSNRYDYVASPVVKAVRVPTFETVDTNIKKKVDYVPSIFWHKPFYAHFAPASIIKDGYNRKTIGSESLDEVRMAARLGFDFVEANIHITSDGDFVCLHGETGDVFGSEFIDLNGGNTSEMVVAETSMDYIKQYIRYDSDIPKYQVAPPSLDEFIQCCKENNIGLFVGTNNQAAIQKCIDVLNDRIIVYGPPANIRTFFKGHLYFWNNRATDNKADLMATMRQYGKPGICAIGPTALTALKNNNELEDLVAELHAEGFYFGGAAVYQTEKETQEDFIRMGADCLGSGHQVNEFEANLKVVDLDGDASDFNLGNATISDNVITMAQGDMITFGPTQEISLGKSWLSVKFNGQLTINFGSVTTRSGLTGDGVSETILSDFLLHRNGVVRIIAETATVISGLVYKVSVC